MARSVSPSEDGSAANEVRFTTAELSPRTWADYERFFTHNGRGSCACMLYPRGRHLSDAQHPSRAERRDLALAEKKRLVDQDRTHGILVYADGEPVGWCQYGSVDELPLEPTSTTAPRLLAREPDTRWRITCFVTLRPYRRQGVASLALTAAVESIRAQGEGWVEALPIASTYHDAQLVRLKKTYGPRSRQVEDHLRTRRWPETQVAGIGRVAAADGYFGNVSHPGTVGMFERLGFRPVRGDQGGAVLMRLRV